MELDLDMNKVSVSQTSFHEPITSEHILYIRILLLPHIADASTGTCDCRDEIHSRSRSSSILDHFPGIRRSNMSEFNRSIDLYSLSIFKNIYSMYGYYFCTILPMLAQALVIVETKSIQGRGRVPSWTIFLVFDEAI